jgi:hypothetical protein
MSVELTAAYERIAEMKLAFRALQDIIQSVDSDDDRDIALGMIEDQLDDNTVR